jgi:hypothetical protein
MVTDFRRAAVEKNIANRMERNDMIGNAKSLSSIWDFNYAKGEQGLDKNRAFAYVHTEQASQ